MRATTILQLICAVLLVTGFIFLARILMVCMTCIVYIKRKKVFVLDLLRIYIKCHLVYFLVVTLYSLLPIKILIKMQSKPIFMIMFRNPITNCKKLDN